MLIKCLKKSGQINDERKIIEKHTFIKRTVYEMKNRECSTTCVSRHIYVYQYMSQFWLTSKGTAIVYCVEIIVVTSIFWDRCYSEMEKSQLFGCDEYYLKERKL